MGGRALTRWELLWLHRGELPHILGRRVLFVLRGLAAFVRWVYLRATGKTAYRFAPMYETKILTGGHIRQANGLYLPYPKRQRHFDDVRADVVAAWNAVEAKDK